MGAPTKSVENGNEIWRDGLGRLHRDPSEGPAVTCADGRVSFWTEGICRAVFQPPTIGEDGLVHAWAFKGTMEEAKAQLPKRPHTGPLYAAALMFM